MAFVFEKVPEEDWHYFNSFNINYHGEHYCADKYTQWAADKEREIYLIWLPCGGLEMPNVYALVWKLNVIFVETEERPTYIIKNNKEIREMRWLIERICVPRGIDLKKSEILAAINEAGKSMCVLSKSDFVVTRFPELTFA